MALVDVCVPCYRYGKYLRQCVDSALSQEGVSVRVLILDDASPDDTADVARQLMRRDGRVQYLRNAKNLGHIATYNIGLEWCRGDYNVLLSADDLLTPGALVRASGVLDARSEVGLVYGLQVIYPGDGPPPEIPLTATGGWTVVTGQRFIAGACETTHNIVPTPTAVVRTSIQKRVGGYRADLPHAGDMEMWLRVAAHSDVAAIDAYQAYYRVHPTNMNKAYSAAADHWQRKGALDAVFDQHGERIQDRLRLQRLYQQRLGESAFWSASRAWSGGDAQACRELLDTSVRLWPDVHRTPAWARFRWKRRLGALARLIEPHVDHARMRARGGSRPNSISAAGPA